MNDSDRIEARLLLKPHTTNTLHALSAAFDVPGSQIAAAFLDHFLTMTSGTKVAALLRQERNLHAGQALAQRRARESAKRATRRTKPPGSET